MSGFIQVYNKISSDSYVRHVQHYSVSVLPFLPTWHNLQGLARHFLINLWNINVFMFVPPHKFLLFNERYYSLLLYDTKKNNVWGRKVRKFWLWKWPCISPMMGQAKISLQETWRRFKNFYSVKYVYELNI